MARSTSSEDVVYDLLILVDATSSMQSFLTSLTYSLPQVISISALTNCFERIGLLAYRDYCDRDLLEWSGWMTGDMETDPDLAGIARKLQAIGGGDYPEATKTGLAKACEVMRKEAKTLILLYTDAPPHGIDAEDTGYKNALDEQEALKKPDSYGGYGPLFNDWVKGACTLRDGEKKAQVISIFDGDTQGYYNFLSAITGGASVLIQESASRDYSLYKSPSSRAISEVTVEVLLAWMGVRKEGAASINLPAHFEIIEPAQDLLKADNERHSAARFHLGVHKASPQASRCVKGFKRLMSPRVRRTKYIKLSTETLDKHLPKRHTPLQDFAKTYKENAGYRVIVTQQLRKIIDQDVAAISLNPVFGSLWRTVCNDRENGHRQELLDRFGRSIDAIKDAGQRAQMKAWLEESYDYTAEVMETIAAVPEEQRFPCVCLDPTLAFTRAASCDDDDEAIEERDNQTITSFRRDELLEIGRSCDGKILRRLGRILTNLTYIESAADLPAHIAAADEVKVPRIPMMLASKEHRRQFWRILLHIVVPGTMLGARASTVLAALSIRLGVQPLAHAAEQQMLFWRDKWNDIDIPETWNLNCLSLILDADKAYCRKVAEAEARSEDRASLLSEADRQIFERLVDYKLLELNLNTTLTARVSWTPEKSTMPIGPLVVCQSCQYPRSVTIMGPDGMCGLCCVKWDNDDVEKAAKSLRVTKTDTEATDAVWCECNVQYCRVQYVVYQVEGLHVRPKCHYCRIQGEGATATTAPFVECTKCLSRMIWPHEYRTSEDWSDWICVACSAGQKTVVDIEITAQQLRVENGDDWLLSNVDNKIEQPFANRSLYKVASEAVPLSDLCAKVTILPAHSSAKPTLPLHHRGKLIQNTPALLAELTSWIHRRRTESSTCSLCFTSHRKTALLAACGRAGCHQRICAACLQSWYGLNAPGRIINTAALACPFCRRPPAAKTLAKYGMGIHSVANLSCAIAKRGEWIFAWCADCGSAKEYMERVCARGTPPEVSDWRCEECRESAKGGKVVRYRACPGCGVETEKSGGCDHIECTACGTHWCFFCGERQDQEGIYEHMEDVHGGMYGGAWTEDEGDEDD